MKTEYDFSDGERGKFYRPDAKLNLPVYLDEKIMAYLNKRAESKGIEVNQLVNEMLQKDIDLIETVKGVPSISCVTSGAGRWCSGS